MKVAIMQPYFFPYLGYFSLIHSSDLWVFFDDIQFIRHGWIDRNRILDSNNNPIYFRPNIIKHSRETFIRHVLIDNSKNWKDKIFAQLTSYKKKAPNYFQTIELLKYILSKDFDNISELNIHIINQICSYLGISINSKIYSELDVKVNERINHSGQWALEITKSLGGTKYINPIGGRELFVKSEFEKASIELLFCQNNLSKYIQKNDDFVSGLSIIDVLMFNSNDETNELIKDYKLVL